MKNPYAVIAANLREFGYPDVTEEMIREVHDAMRKDEAPLPHGIVGRYARDQLEVLEAVDRELEARP